MKTFFSVLLLLIFLINTRENFAQNLIPNHSFEVYDTCPDFYGELNRVQAWFNPTIATPDYFNACYVPDFYPYVDVPLNNLGYQNPKDGSGYAGLIPFWSQPVTYREYIEVKILQPLEANQKYHVHFYVSLADGSIYATDALGIYFSPDSVTSQSYDALGLQPQVTNAQGNFLTDTANWTEIKGEYTASGGETFLLIGNFKNQQNTDSIQVLSIDTSELNPFVLAYYWIDDVCVATDSSQCDCELNIPETGSSDKISIGPNPTDDFLIVTANSSLKSVEIINLLGQNESSEKIMSGNKNLQVDVSQLPAAYYFVKVQTENKVFIGKVLVTHWSR